MLLWRRRTKSLKLLVSLAGLAIFLVLALLYSLTSRDSFSVVDHRERDREWVDHASQPLAAEIDNNEYVRRNSHMRSRSPKAIKNTDPNIVRLSESVDIRERGKFQMEQVDKYCSERKDHLGEKFQLPKNEEEQQLLYRHLLYDDYRQAMFCFVEKIGCTDMKRMWFVSVGELPIQTIDDEWVDLKYLEKGIRRVSLLNKNLSDTQRLEKVQNYYKFTIIRHPLERLVSAFRNKIEPPLTDLSVRFPNYIKLNILQKYRSKEFKQWMERTSVKNLTVTFEEFVLYFVNSDLTKVNPHIKPVIYSCHPCRVRYDFYGNFQTYSQDAHMAMESLGIDLSFYRDKSLHSSSQKTSEYLEKYYGQLSSRLKSRLYQKLIEELEFYYALFPREKNSHFDTLGISNPS